ncbi:MAG: hypothetical protein M1834_005564 [Cirrosporium novae-zelandiae]|nr:MAG: hypothetical protein M1834_005564 [Cirrosporium novae-zelandiae]
MDSGSLQLKNDSDTWTLTSSGDDVERNVQVSSSQQPSNDATPNSIRGQEKKSLSHDEAFTNPCPDPKAEENEDIDFGDDGEYPTLTNNLKTIKLQCSTIFHGGQPAQISEKINGSTPIKHDVELAFGCDPKFLAQPSPAPESQASYEELPKDKHDWRWIIRNFTPSMYNTNINHLSHVTGAFLLPVVAPIVASSCGAIVAGALAKTNPAQAVWTVVVSYILWAIGMPLAMMTLAVYFHRLTVHKIPPREVIVSVFLPIGPLGQGGFGIQKLGLVSKEVFSQTSNLPINASNAAGDILYIIGWFLGLMCWGFALVWFFFALASIYHSRPFPFNMGWWGFVFPIGVFTTCTTQLGKDFPSKVFDVVGIVATVCVVLLWLLVSIRTIHGLVVGTALVAPCLRDLEQRVQMRTAEKAV